MEALFREIPEAVANTGAIAERCNVELEFRTQLPAFPLAADAASPDDYLERLAREGLTQRYANVTPELEERLAYELAVIRKTGYSGYFLIVADFIRAARERGIPVGPGRGSVGGSLVAYCLRITELDPLRYGLIFERFLNPERISMPDIDIDFCYERRGEILQYVKEKYGESNVAQIITFGTMKARAAVRDVARVLQIPLAEADHIAKLIPNAPGFSMEIADCIEKVAEIRALHDAGGIHRRLIDSSRALEGLARHASVHAAGVVITPTELWNYVPLYRSEKSELTTQWDMHAVERAGLLKMDFLGLKTLTVLHYAVEDLQESEGVRLDLSRLPENDRETMKMLGEGKTEGVFQFEGNVPSDVLRRMKPDTFEDLVAVNALIRPGPLDSGMTDAFIRRKRGQEAIRYPHPDLEPILKNTYGVITYQEDVLKIAQVMGGFTLAQADVMRKAMGKKIQALIDEQVTKFVAAAVARGYDPRTAREVADQIVTFGRYGFNRAHAVGYTILSYQTAFLKRHYPRQYMAALLSSEMGNTDKVVRYIGTCRAMGIDVLPPDVNESRLRFTTVPGGIRFGLGAVKNVGFGAVEAILQARAAGGPFRSLFELCERVDMRLVNKRVLECLLMAGAFDSLGGHRAQLMAVLESAIASGARKQEERRLGQFGLFGEAEAGSGGSPGDGVATGSGESGSGRAFGEPPLPEVTPWPQAEALQKEKELLGFYVSAHPLDRHRTLMRYYETCETTRIPELAQSANGYGATEVVLAGMLGGVRVLRDRKGNTMAFATLEDFAGTADCILFSEVYEACRELLATEKPVLVRGTLSTKGEDDLKVIASQVIPIDQAARLLEIRVPRSRLESEPDLLAEVKRLLVANSGTTPVKVCLTEGENESCVLSRSLQVAVTSRLLDLLAARLGEEALRLVSPFPPVRRPEGRASDRGPRYAGGGLARDLRRPTSGNPGALPVETLATPAASAAAAGGGAVT
jgi:DNA polymerase-3 subunit alpha